MCKTMSKTTKMSKTVKMINDGHTWEEVEFEIGVCRTYIQKLLRTGYYKSEARYNNLLRKARENAKAKKEVEDANTVIVSEAGALIHGFKTSKEVIVPQFCKSEVIRYAKEEGINPCLILNRYNINWAERREERIAKLPAIRVKPRTIGVIAVCCDLVREGKKVQLYTNSNEIFTLANNQGLEEITTIKI